ncbi:MAG: acylglycerol lipase [Gammaproteobacteria bacterium]|jgi:acylglycerol lipase
MGKNITSKPEDVQYYFHKAQTINGDKARCAFVFVHGLRDHAGTHTFFFEQLNREGCHILSFDLLGHGYSAGERCSINDYKQHVVVVWRSIIRALREHIPQRIPVVIMGYSYGFSLVVHALHELIEKHASVERIIRKRVAIVIGLSPAFKVGHTASPAVRFFAPVLSFLSRHIKNIPLMSPRPDRITDDEGILNIIETDPQVFKGRINVQTARNVDVAGRSALRLLPLIKLPFLLVFGSEDFVKPVTKEEIKDCEDIQVRMIPGGKHNIFDGNNIYAGRTLESIMRVVEQYC